MKTVQMKFDENLLTQVDRVVSKLNTTRSAFTRKALKEFLKLYQTKQLELQHIEGYKKYPVKEQEFSIWENEQEWCE
jgi:metal-responsive CopG/Arc/MetJ family transcriptional regulator